MSEEPPRRARQKKTAPDPISYADKGMEKAGKLLITAEELKNIRSGNLPKRLETEWELTLAEARDMVMFGCYEVIKG